MSEGGRCLGGDGKKRAAGRLYFFQEKIDNSAIDIIAAKTGIAVGRQDLEHPLVQLENRKIKCAATQIVYCDPGVFFKLVEAVSQSCGCRLIDNAFDRKAGQFAGLLGGIALRVVKVSGHGDNGSSDWAIEIGLGIAFQFFEDLRGNFFRSEGSTLNVNGNRTGTDSANRVSDEHFLLRNVGPPPPHKTLYRIDSFSGFEDAHPISRDTDERLGIRRGEMNDRRGQPTP